MKSQTGTPERSSRRKSLNSKQVKQILEDSGIEVLEDPGCLLEYQLPTEIDDLRLSLLNFNDILPIRKKWSLEQMISVYQKKLKESDATKRSSGVVTTPAESMYCDSGHLMYRARWKAALALCDRAKALANRERESEWNSLMANFVFENINYQASCQGTLLQDLFCWGSDQLFTNTTLIRGHLRDAKNEPIELKPKPDYWFGLSLYEDEQLDRLQGLERKDDNIKCYTLDNLNVLRDKFGQPNFAYRPVGTAIHSAFPWMVVELKKEYGDEKAVLNQAANASLVCLRINHKLAKLANKKPCPVVAFTAVGPKVKIFIAHENGCDEKEPVYRLSCIWEGDIQYILHAVQLRRIIDQLIFWASRIFKPWVTDCLRICRSLPSSSPGDGPIGKKKTQNPSTHGSATSESFVEYSSSSSLSETKAQKVPQSTFSTDSSVGETESTANTPRRNPARSAKSTPQSSSPCNVLQEKAPHAPKNKTVNRATQYGIQCQNEARAKLNPHKKKIADSFLTRHNDENRPVSIIKTIKDVGKRLTPPANYWRKQK